jgi:hypothetical protein
LEQVTVEQRLPDQSAPFAQSEFSAFFGVVAFAFICTTLLLSRGFFFFRLFKCLESAPGGWRLSPLFREWIHSRKGCHPICGRSARGSL